MDIFNQFATDETLENNGTFVKIGQGAELLIARTGNAAYSKLLSRLYERSMSVLDLKDDAADEKSKEIMTEVLVSTVLLGWKGVKYKGEDMAYSVENAKKLLALKDFRRMVVTHSENMESFRMHQERVQGEV